MTDSYIWIALLSASTFGMVTVLDKRLASRNMPSLPAFYMGVVISLISYGIIAFLITGIPGNISGSNFFASAISGVCWGGALAMMFWGYKLEEASRASAIIHTFPVFVAVLAVIFLGETLIITQWVAILIVVAGAFTISVWGSEGGQIIRVNRALPILLGASLFTALAMLSGKYALEELPVWFVYSIRNFGMGLVFLFLWRPGSFRVLFGALRNWQTFLLLFLAEFSLAPLAVLLNVTAISLGPVSLVSTITGTRPIFVFIFGTLLSTSRFKLLEEPLDSKTLTVKFVSIAMIVIGIGVLTLS